MEVYLYPDALSSRLLKSKYYSRNDFLNARLRSNPRFIWRSIWFSQAILARGICWSDGHYANILSRSWLCDLENFYIQTQIDKEQYIVTVWDLIDPSVCQWNIIVLQVFFQPRDIEEITKIPQSSPTLENKGIMNISCGIYSIKSGYKLLMDFYNESNNLSAAFGTWAKMWKLKLPPKIKLCLWLIVRNCFLCCKNLQTEVWMSPYVVFYVAPILKIISISSLTTLCKELLESR